jgi:Ctr copper transporter family
MIFKNTTSSKYPQFSSWKIETKWEFALSWFAVVIFAIIYHAIRYLMYILEDYMHGAYQGGSQVPPEDNSQGQLETDILRNGQMKDSYQRVGSSQNSQPQMTLEKAEPGKYMLLRILHGLVAGTNYGVALLLMLVAMTFNPSLFIALMFGYAVGDFIFFARMRPTSSDSCH